MFVEQTRRLALARLVYTCPFFRKRALECQHLPQHCQHSICKRECHEYSAVIYLQRNSPTKRSPVRGRRCQASRCAAQIPARLVGHSAPYAPEKAVHKVIRDAFNRMPRNNRYTTVHSSEPEASPLLTIPDCGIRCKDSSLNTKKMLMPAHADKLRR